MKGNKNIGDLFKERLESFEDPNINQDWLEMEMKLHKVKFLKFSLTNFNIYYCSCLLATFALSSTVFIKSFFFDNNIQDDSASAIITNSVNKSNDQPEMSVQKNKEGDAFQKKDKALKNQSGGTSSVNIGGNVPLNKNEISRKEDTKTKIANSENKINDLNHNQKNQPTNTKNIGNESNAVQPLNSDLTNKTIDNSSNTTTKISNNIVPTENKSQLNNSAQSTSTTNTVNDNLNMNPSPKKNVIYITKQDTIEVFDTLRRKKPFKRK